MLTSKISQSSSKSSSTNPKTPKKVNAQHHHIAPWVWYLFIGSLLLWFGVILLTAQRPVLVPLDIANPTNLPPLTGFLEVPQDIDKLWLPIGAVLGFGILLRWIKPSNTSRVVVRSVTILLAVRYLVWRSLTTLNFSHWISLSLSLLFFLNEIVWIGSYLLYLLQSTWTNEKRRRREADYYSQTVLSGEYLPSVDVFIPTYKEPEFIVRRTVIGCQEMDYSNKTVYVLDDTRRPHIRAMAEELGCKYITRLDNTHAKAGNLNNALAHTKGELITIMDADFVPFRHFLTRTVGFFQNRKIDLVQTPQHFYNPDYHAYNLGLDRFLPNDMEHFFGFVQPGRDAGNSVICCGTSYVVRRQALEAIGGYYTRCCVEDYQTSTRMLTQGQHLIYLNEILSMGESTRTFADFIDQRLRWLQGNLQVYFCGDDLPIWSRLNWIQKSYHINLILYCLNPVVRFISLTVPLISLYLGSSPLVALAPDYMYYVIPFLLLYNVSFTWANNYRLSAFWNEVYETAFCFPALSRLGLILRNPFAKASTATRKGVKAETKNYNLHLTWQLIVLILLTVVGLVFHYGGYLTGRWPYLQYEYAGKEILVFWSIYNLVVMTVAVLAAIDQPVRRVVDRFPVRTLCRLTVGHQIYVGYTHDLSEAGARLTLKAPMLQSEVSPEQPAYLEFLEEDFTVKTKVLRWGVQDDQIQVSLQFIRMTQKQNQRLVSWLYSGMTWWKQPKKPGVLDSLLAMVAAVLRLKPVLRRYV
ncbi:Beta-monoglucosyldiacylglycerol synthase [Halomicronema hongdechloris C2206]|uniref:Beta-monoglucosyldiacylglycerol synthase n=1 Tax=Halomicronema hongdechloris C2206 TaxID=1641165 RepID=A0A1Z3HL25_9CYAN|nr:glycosyltransferase [Halomicronema hongdechloris]ASC71003.1 Beta-monoglucosyldiacylglycerol synthase [Halomicronema hongdechloris C2206]